MSKNTNKYADACNVANKFLDTVFDALNLKNAEKYHITEDELKSVVDNTKEKVSTSKEYIQELSNGMKLDLTNLMDTINSVFSEYKEKYFNEDKESSCPQESCDICNSCYSKDTDKNCGDDECYDDECYDYIENLPEHTDYTPEYCHDITERLKEEFEELSYIDETEDLYPYEEVLYDINTILDDFDNADYELIPANEKCKHDTVHVVYHIGYDSEIAKQEYKFYVNKLCDDLRELYGFSEVIVSIDDTSNDEYMTFNIYMLI